MGTYHFTIGSIVRELGSTDVEADSRDAAVAMMKKQVEAGDFDASWPYSESLLLRVIEVEDPDGSVTCLEGDVIDACETAGHA